MHSAPTPQWTPLKTITPPNHMAHSLVRWKKHLHAFRAFAPVFICPILVYNLVVTFYSCLYQNRVCFCRFNWMQTDKRWCVVWWFCLNGKWKEVDTIQKFVLKVTIFHLYYNKRKSSMFGFAFFYLHHRFWVFLKKKAAGVKNSHLLVSIRIGWLLKFTLE